jgi:glycosyl transferase family 2
MPDKLPRVCVFGATGLQLFSSASCPAFETRALDCRCYTNDDELERVLVNDDPSVILTVGKPQDFPKLYRAPADITRRWINFESASDLERMGAAAFFCFVDNCVRERTDLPPLVSVFTPTYRTGTSIQRPYASLRSQTYTNWEWIIVDDSDDDGATFRMLSELARADHRIAVFKPHAHSGVLGRVKRWACRLANGPILAELDHDDELTPHALADVVRAFRHFDGSAAERPLAGFVYTDFAEIRPDGSAVTYTDGWAFGYGGYRWERWGERTLAVANAPNVNPKTIRHIVGVPNHLRAWRRDTYDDVGGHGRHVHVADDYELLVRTFLGTRMVRVPRLGYLQWRNPSGAIQHGNTHQERNQEIQRLTRAFSQRHDAAIHQRFVELGVDDFVWQAGEDSFARLSSVQNPSVEPHCTLLFSE